MAVVLSVACRVPFSRLVSVVSARAWLRTPYPGSFALYTYALNTEEEPLTKER